MSLENSIYYRVTDAIFVLCRLPIFTGNIFTAVIGKLKPFYGRKSVKIRKYLLSKICWNRNGFVLLSCVRQGMELTNLLTLIEHEYVFELLLWKFCFGPEKFIFWPGKSFFTTIILLPFYGRVFTAVNGKKIEVGKFCRKFTVESIGFTGSWVHGIIGAQSHRFRGT